MKLYAWRYEVIGMIKAADILREVIERYMPDNDSQATSKEDDTERQASELSRRAVMRARPMLLITRWL